MSRQNWTQIDLLFGNWLWLLYHFRKFILFDHSSIFTEIYLLQFFVKFPKTFLLPPTFWLTLPLRKVHLPISRILIENFQTTINTPTIIYILTRRLIPLKFFNSLMHRLLIDLYWIRCLHGCFTIIRKNYTFLCSRVILTLHSL